MLLGQKIKELRLEKKMTQSALADGIVTRNMLSEIENGIAQPSISTMTELAARLDAPLAYFFSETGDLSTFRKLAALDKIKKSFTAGEYAKCLARLQELGVSDDETEFLAAKSELFLGIEFYNEGLLESAKMHLNEAIAHAKKTIYAEAQLTETAQMFESAIPFVRDGDAGMLLLAKGGDLNEANLRADLAYIRALATKSTEFDYEMVCPFYAEHLRARADLFARHYELAASAISEILEALGKLHSEKERNRWTLLRYYLLFDLEACGRAVGDFKLAYESSVARLSITERMGK